MCSAVGCEFCFIAQHAFALTLEVEDLVEELEHVKKKAAALIASIFSRQNVASCVHIHLCRETCVQLCAYTCVCGAYYPERTPPQPDQAKCVQRGLNSAKRQHRREEQRAKQGGLNPAQAKIAMAVHILGGYDVVMAGTFASLQTQATGSDGVESLGTNIRDMCLAVPLDSLLRFEIPTDRGDEAVRTAALKFIAEHRTFSYVAEANTAPGVAPSSHDAASQYIRQCDELGATASDPSLRKALANEYPSVQTAKHRLRKWTQKFKKVWGLGFGPLRTRNPIPQAELEEKAGGIFK